MLLAMLAVEVWVAQWPERLPVLPPAPRPQTMLFDLRLLPVTTTVAGWRVGWDTTLAGVLGSERLCASDASGGLERRR